MATDGNIDGFLVQKAVRARNTDHAKIHHPMLCQEHSRLCRYSKIVHLPGTGAGSGNYRGRPAGSEMSITNNGYTIHDEISYPCWTITWQKHHILTYSTYVQGNSWTKSKLFLQVWNFDVNMLYRPKDRSNRCTSHVLTQGVHRICTPIPNLYIMGEISYSLQFLVTIWLTSIWGRVFIVLHVLRASHTPDRKVAPVLE